VKVTESYDEETEQFTGDVEILSGKIADLTKTADNPGGVSLFTDDSKETFKSTTQLLRDISEIYDELTDKQQAELLEKLASKRQGQIVAAILNNFDAVESSLKTMENSAGNAEAEMSVIMDSMEYKINKLKETGTGVFQNLFKTEDMGNIVELLTDVLNVVDFLTNKVGLLGTAMIAVPIVSFIKNFGELKLLGIQGSTSITAVSAAIKGLTIDEAAAALATTNLSEAEIAAVLVKNGFTSATALETAANIVDARTKEAAAASTMGLAGAETTATATTSGLAGATGGLTAAFNGLKAAIVSNPIGFIATVAVAAFVTINTIINSIESASEKLENSSEKVADAKSELDGLNSELSTTQKRIIELNQLDSLTLVQKNELRDLKKTNAELKQKIALQKQLLLTEQKANEDNFVKAVNSKTNSSENSENFKWYYPLLQNIPLVSLFNEDVRKWKYSDHTNNQQRFDNYVENYSKADDDKLTKDVFGNTIESKKAMSEFMGKYIQELSDYVEQLGDYDYKSLSDEAKKSVDLYYDNLNKFSVIMGEYSDAWNGVYNQQRFDSAREKIEEVSKDGLTGDELSDLYNNNSDVKAMIDNMKEVGLISGNVEDNFAGIALNISKADKNIDSFSNNEKISFSDLMKNESFTDQVDDYKDKLTELDEALEKLRDGTLSEEDKTDLFMDFPELAGQADNLDEAITNLISDTENNAIDYFDKKVGNMDTEESVNALNNLKNSILGLSNATGHSSEVEEYRDILNHLETKESCDNIDELTEKMKSYADEYNRLVGYGKKGNVDYNKRPVVSKDDVKEKYPDFDGDYATTYDQGYEITDSSGKNYAVVVTPILENGKILSQEELDKYIDDVLEGSDDVLEADTKNLIIHAEAEGEGDYWIKNDDGSLEFDFESFNEQLIPAKEGHLEAYLDINTNMDDLIPYADKLGISVEQLKSIGDIPADLFASADEVTDKISKLTSEIDGLSDTYSDMISIIEDYNDNGYLTLDNLQSIMDMEPEYINLLIDENGQINLNSQAYKDYVASKAKSLLVNELQDLYNSILGMQVEEAQAYANAQAYDEETESVQSLLNATTKLYYAKAMAKDSANNTTAYTDALSQSFNTAANYAAMVDSYISSLSTPLNEFDVATEEATDSTDEMTSALEAEKDALESQKDALEDSKDSLEDYKDSITDAQSDIQSLIDLVTDYIKQTKEDEKSAIQDSIDALEDKKTSLDEQKDAYSELIDKRKEEIEALYEEKKAQDELSEKQKSVAKDALALAVAQLDDSSAGRKAQKQAQDNLNTSNKDLKDYLDEQEKDKRIEALENDETEYEEMIEKRKAAIDEQVEYYESKIDEIDAYLDNSRQMYEDACAMIDNDTGELYSKLWNEYVYPYTTQTRAEFDHLWSSAQEAIQKYIGDNGTLIGTMEWLQTEIYTTESQIAELDSQIGILDDSIDDIDESINSVSSSVDTQKDKVGELGKSWSSATSDVSKYIDELNKIPDSVPAVNNTSNQNDIEIPSDAKWYFDYYKNGKLHRAWSKSRDYNVAVQDIMREIQKETGQYRSDVYGGIKKRYAVGTYSSIGGVAVTQENNRLEEIFGKLQNGQYTMMSEGSHVLTPQATTNLHKFADNPPEFVAQALSYSGYLGRIENAARNVVRNIDNRSMGNTEISAPIQISIQGDATQSTVNALRAESKNIEESIIKKLVRIREGKRGIMIK